MITTEPNPYWEIVMHRAAAVWEAHCQPGADLAAGMPVYLQHAQDFELIQATHIAQMCLTAVVHEDAPAATRAADGTVNFDRLVPPGSDPGTRNAAADYLIALCEFSLSQAVEAADQQMTALSPARTVIQTVLNGAPMASQGANGPSTQSGPSATMREP